MRICTFLCFFLVVMVSSFAQDSIATKDSSKYYSHSYLGFSYQNQMFPNLNSRIVKHFPRSIPEHTIGIALGGKTAWDALLIQGEIGIAAGINGNRNEGATNIGLFYASMDGGLFLTRGMIRIYPFAGLGLDAVVISAKLNNRNIAFDSLLSNPLTRESLNPVRFNAFYVTWRSGLAIDLGNNNKRGLPYSLGLRAGYRQSFHSSRWNFNGMNGFIGTPSDRLEQWFASLVFYGKIIKMPQSKNSGRK